VQVTRHNSCWVSPFGHPRINARLPTPQGISQAPTSFIGSRCQGIHHAPLPTCHTNHQHTQQKHRAYRTARASMIKTQNNQRYRSHYKQTNTTHKNLLRVPYLLASTMKKSNNQSPTSPTTPTRDDGGLMPQTPNSVPHKPLPTHSRAVAVFH
jgi:hypothetical protein